MEAEFDKEMDALLRRAAGRSVLTGNDGGAHLDADTISAFAENSLPVKSRTIYTQHLAACDPCRMSLANMIRLNDAEPALAAAATPAPAVAMPWYRKLFQAPNLAYVMGGLVLVFGGLLGVIVLQNSNNSDGATISQVANTHETQRAPERAEASNAVSSATGTNSNAASNIPGEIPRSVGVAEMEQPADSDALAVSPPPPAVSASGDTATAGVPLKDLSIDGMDKAKAAQLQPAPVNAPKREDDAQEKKEVKLAAEPENRKQDLNLNAGNLNNQQQNVQMPNNAAKSMGPSRNAIQRDNRDYEVNNRQVENLPLNSRSVTGTAVTPSGERAASTRSVGGKTFEMKQGAWYDTAYSGKKTKNVRRSSDDYRKLDSGLRNIAETLGGTVVVVWNGKAYRIQ